MKQMYIMSIVIILCRNICLAENSKPIRKKLGALETLKQQAWTPNKTGTLKTPETLETLRTLKELYWGHWKYQEHWKHPGTMKHCLEHRGHWKHWGHWQHQELETPRTLETVESPETLCNLIYSKKEWSRVARPLFPYVRGWGKKEKKTERSGYADCQKLS